MSTRIGQIRTQLNALQHDSPALNALASHILVSAIKPRATLAHNQVALQQLVHRIQGPEHALAAPAAQALNRCCSRTKEFMPNLVADIRDAVAPSRPRLYGVAMGAILAVAAGWVGSTMAFTLGVHATLPIVMVGVGVFVVVTGVAGLCMLINNRRANLAARRQVANCVAAQIERMDKAAGSKAANPPAVSMSVAENVVQNAPVLAG